MDPAAPADPPRRRWPRRLAAAAALLAALAAALLWGLPPLLSAWLQRELPAQLGQRLGRTVSVDAVRVVPWRLALEIDGLSIAAATPDRPPTLQLQRLVLDLAWQSLHRRAPVVEALALQAPRLQLRREADGRLDIADVLQRLTAGPATAATDAEPARFALYNLRLSDGELRLDDRVSGQVQHISALQLALPFLSNFPADVEVHTEPQLSLRLNGTALSGQARALPFSRSRQGELTLQLQRLDLAPWLAYQPATLPLRLQRGQLSGQLALRFSQPSEPADGAPQLTLRGELALEDGALGAGHAPLLSWQRLQLGLADVQPLARRIQLGMLRLDGLQLDLLRERDGRLQLQRLLAGAGAEAGPATPAPQPQPAPAAAWQLGLQALQIADAQIAWRDASLPGQPAWQARSLALQAGPLGWPLAAPVPLRLSAALWHQGQDIGGVQLQGQADPRSAALELELQGLALAAARPWLAPWLKARLDGRLSARASLQARLGDSAPQLSLDLQQARLDRLSLRPSDGGTPLRLAQLALGASRLDLATRQIQLGRLALSQPQLQLHRDAQDRWNWQDWLVPPANTPQPAAGDRDRGPDWRLSLAELAVDGGRLRFSDASVAASATLAEDEAPAAAGAVATLALDSLRLRLRQAAWPPLPGRDWPLELSLRTAPAGQLRWSGRLGLQGLQPGSPPTLARVDGRLQLQRLPLQRAEPWLAEALGPLTLLRAEAGLDARLSARQGAQGWQLQARSDLQLNELQLHTRPEAGGRLDAGSELLSWESLRLDGLQLTLAPPARPRLDLAAAELRAFYSRLVITEDGRFNLRDVAGEPQAAARTEAETSAAAPPAAAASGPALPLDLAVGGIRLVDGRVDFTDRFIRPNYSARLSALNGTIGAFRSDSPEMATLALSGRAADTAALEISGQINPSTQPPALDLRARASGLELAPLSPYAGKYAGYGIERGKLSLDLAYKIEPDGRLQADHRLVLDQLTFGQRVDSPDATSLPVRLAVALLADRHGVIDLNLPVGGSLSDPQFSIGGIVLKLIVNLIGKALTAPFALLSGGGGPDLSQVGFVAGTNRPTAEGEASLDRVAQALLDRPALTMTVAGAADPVGEREAWQQAALEQRLQAERRRQRLRAGQAVDDMAAAAITGDERQRLLRELYRQTPLPDRPRNLIGQLKELPAPEMEARLKAALLVSTEVARELALQRGLAVRDALVARGLPPSRLFLGAPRLRAATEDEATWQPRVELSLALP
ncbi:MAG: DUF748 domain-containing protein [Burkholderiaceae bacterium]|nr:DUF748 domain-containing protein [Burkholderiaceae bacterium]